MKKVFYDSVECAIEFIGRFLSFFIPLGVAAGIIWVVILIPTYFLAPWHMNHYPNWGIVTGKEIVVQGNNQHLVYYKDKNGKDGQMPVLEKDYSKAEPGDEVTVKFGIFINYYSIWHKSKMEKKHNLEAIVEK